MNINELNNLVSINVEKYNQITIDFVDEAEDIIDFTDKEDVDAIYFLERRIFIENLLQIIDLKNGDDIFVLNQLCEILKEKQKDYENK